MNEQILMKVMFEGGQSLQVEGETPRENYLSEVRLNDDGQAVVRGPKSPWRGAYFSDVKTLFVSESPAMCREFAYGWNAATYFILSRLDELQKKG